MLSVALCGLSGAMTPAPASAAARHNAVHLAPVQVKQSSSLYAVYKIDRRGVSTGVQALGQMGKVLDDRGAFVTMELSSRAVRELRQHHRVDAFELGRLKIQGLSVDFGAENGGGGAIRSDLGQAAGFYIVQFRGFPKPEWFQALTTLGGRQDISGYFADFGYLYWSPAGAAVAISGLEFVNAVVPFYPRLKGPVGSDGTPLVKTALKQRKWQVLVPSWIDLRAVKERLAQIGLEVSDPFKHVGDRSTFVIEGPAELAARATELPEVAWVEPLYPAGPALTVARKLHQAGGGGACIGTLAEVPVWAGGITGAGTAPACSTTVGTEQLIGVLDTTFNSPDLACAAGIPNCTIFKYSSYLPPGCSIQNFVNSCIPGNYHGSSVAGILAGNASQEGGTSPIEACRRKGQSFGGRLWALACGDGLDCLTSCHNGSEQVVINEFFQRSYADGSRLSSHSWSTYGSDYNLESEAVDFWAYDNDGDPTNGVTQKYLWFFAAGNRGSGAGTVDQPAGAKDDVTAGAVYNGSRGSCDTGDSPPCDETKVVNYSSRGPTPDGRHGVDANGASQFVSTLNDGTGFYEFSGTSAATPSLASMGALLRDWLIQRRGMSDPNAALVKALLLNSGDYVPNTGGSPESLPGPAQGWGRPNLSNLCDNWSSAGCQSVQSLWQEGEFTASGTQFGPISIQVTDASKPLRCMLAWMDRPNLASGGALVNNLDLQVTAPGGTCYRGNNFSGAWSVSGCAGNFDSVNVDEGVRVQTPALGVWYVDVISAHIADGPQPWAVVCSGGIEAPPGSLAVTGVTVQDVCASGGPGNGNGVIEPGELITLPIRLTNQSLQGITQISGLLSSQSTGATVTRSSGSWPNLAAGASATSNPDHFQFSLANTITCGTRLNFNMALTSSAGPSTVPFPLFVGGESRSLLLNESFSGGIPASWTILHHGSGTGEVSTWTATNPCGRGIGPPFATPWAMGDSACAGPTVSLDEELITPTVNASTCTQVNLEFSNQFICAGGTCLGGGDLAPGQEGDVDVSTNGGGTWTNVLALGNRNDGYPIPNTKYIDLTSVIQPNPANVKIRFYYWRAMNAAWWAIDNVKVRCVAPICNICNP